MKRPVIELNGITKCYGQGATQVTAIANVSTTLYAGEVVALLGPSGSGKSTLLMIAGLLESPTQGEVHINGRLASGPDATIGNVRDFRRKNIGFVFQKPNLIPFLTAQENIRLAMEINDVPAPQQTQTVADLLGWLEIEHRANNYPGQLSGGEQQRVAIARALANHPPLLLADEPTAALDSKRGRQVVSLFHNIAHERDTAVVLVTHDHRCLDLVDRILEMEDGQLIERPMNSVITHDKRN